MKDKIYKILENYEITDYDKKLITDELFDLLVFGKSLPSKGFIGEMANKRGLKFNYVNEIGYLRHKKSFELGAEFVKEHLEKQK